MTEPERCVLVRVGDVAALALESGELGLRCLLC